MDLQNYTQNHISTELRNEITAIINDGTSENTKRALRTDIAYVMGWLEASFLETALPLSPEIVVRFITENLSGLNFEVEDAMIRSGVKASEGPLKFSTIERRCRSLSTLHKMGGFANPMEDATVKAFLQKARKAAAKRGQRTTKKQALTADVLTDLLDMTDAGLRGIRDRALLMVGFGSGGRRRSEIVNIDFEDIKKVPEGFTISLGRTKTDQDGSEDLVVPALGRVGEALDELMRVLKKEGISEGAVFRGILPNGRFSQDRMSEKNVSYIIKSLCEKAGYDAKDFSAHSLRSGFITEGGRKNVNIFQLMEMTGHKSVQTAKGYYRTGNVLVNPAASFLD